MVNYGELLMKLFKKKKIYRVIWAFDSQTIITHTEYVKANDAADAWRQIAKQHYAIDCRFIAEVDEIPPKEIWIE